VIRDEAWRPFFHEYPSNTKYHGVSVTDFSTFSRGRYVYIDYLESEGTLNWSKWAQVPVK